MRVKQVSEICEGNNNFKIDWKQTVVKPLVLGVSFGLGYYLASLFLKTDLMSNLMQEAKSVKLKNLAKIKLSN
jgi:hypothetical protein